MVEQLRRRRARRRRRGRPRRRWPRACFADAAGAALARAAAAPAAWREELERWRGEQEAARPGAPARARGAAALRGRPRRSLRRRRADHGARRRAPRAHGPSASTQRAAHAAPRGRARPRRPTTSTSTTARRPSSSAGWPTSSPACARHEARGAHRRRASLVAAAVLYGLFGHKGRELLERTAVPAALPGDRARRTRANYDLDPALLAAVIYSESRFRPHVRSAHGRDRAHAAAAEHGRGHRRRARAARRSCPPTSTTPRSTCATAPGTCATCGSTTRRCRTRRRSRSRPTTRAWPTSTPGSPNDAPASRCRSRPRSPRRAHYLDGIEHARGVYRRLYPGELGLGRPVVGRAGRFPRLQAWGSSD